MSDDQTVVNAKKIIGKETTPERDGKKLGLFLGENFDQVTGLKIDVSGIAPEDLVSSFINSMLLQFEDVNGSDHLETFRTVDWIAKFPSEADHLVEAVGAYLDVHKTANSA